MGSSTYGYIYNLGSCYTKSTSFRSIGISLKFLNRGLFALAFLIFFQVSLSAEYLYKDEIIFNKKFNDDIEVIGSELYQKTGIKLKLEMVKELKDIHISKYAQQEVDSFKEPTILLVFSEFNSKVDIAVNDKSLYKYFNKEQVLSPAASIVQSFVLIIAAAHSFEDAKNMILNSGGTIIPILTQKTKSAPSTKYQAALFNGYADIADQVASAKGVKLVHSPGSANKTTILYIKTFFYLFVFYAIFMYIKRVKYRRDHADK